MSENRCPSWKEIEEIQVYKVIETGDTLIKVMSKLQRNFGDMWGDPDARRLENAMRRLNKKHLISYNRDGKAWVKL